MNDDEKLALTEDFWRGVECSYQCIANFTVRELEDADLLDELRNITAMRRRMTERLEKMKLRKNLYEKEKKTDD